MLEVGFTVFNTDLRERLNLLSVVVAFEPSYQFYFFRE